jgi:RNA polymerase sigma-70 factor (ECF subfamily)
MKALPRMSHRMHDETEKDEVLMMDYQHGHGPALETLVRRYADSLLGFLVRMTGNRAQAEDLFQETFLRVHLKAATFKPAHRFKSWLYAIAAHLAIDQQRKSGRAPAVSIEADDERLMNRLPDPRPTPADEAAREDRKRQVIEALDALPPRQRATMVLAYFEGLSYPEVAAAMHCSVGTVKTQVSRALRALARLLPEGGPS